MRKAALLYNPDSGGTRTRREVELESALALLRDANVEAQLVLTDSRAHAEEKARQAVLAGCDTIFACGGDGTIHNIIQVLANTSVALAILPMGTANALAHELGLPMNVPKRGRGRSARRSPPHCSRPHRVSRSCWQTGTRFFIVAAGAGVDAHLFYKLHAGTKQRMGMAAYYAKAWHLWFTYPMTRFQVEFAETVGSGAVARAEVTELMAVRIRNFGGVLQELAPGASLDRNDHAPGILPHRQPPGVSSLRDAGSAAARVARFPASTWRTAQQVSCQYLSATPSPRRARSQKSMSKRTANWSARCPRKSPWRRMR